MTDELAEEDPVITASKDSVGTKIIDGRII